MLKIEHITKLISVLHRHSQSHYAKKFEKLGVKSSQFMFILCICDNEGISQDELAKEFKMNKSTITRVVSQLENLEFVYRKINKKDKRICNLYSTEKSKQVYTKIKEILNQWQVIISEGLTEDEKVQLNNILIRIKDNIILYEEKEK